ncbi:MAG: nucleotide exchange factor GrpE [Bacteroidetes bacterium HGW-Bacteroidetes-6]|jgi:molecular chaperone GrpE|nr:MAG: nucleotide exchange factor GrpE [Bacteroidetes bacterium HGW-Bacteroidetes-6]
MKSWKKKKNMSEREEQENLEKEIVPDGTEKGTEENEQSVDCPEAVMETMESLQMKANEWQDKYMRLFADFENYKKRMRQERFELITAAGSDMILEILPVVDDFERGLSSIDSVKDIEAVKQGYLLIYNKLLNILKQKGLEPMNSLDTDFNTDFHEALTMVPNPDKKGKVVDVIEKGYLLKEKVLRFAKVVVGN